MTFRSQNTCPKMSSKYPLYKGGTYVVLLILRMWVIVSVTLSKHSTYRGRLGEGGEVFIIALRGINVVNINCIHIIINFSSGCFAFTALIGDRLWEITQIVHVTSCLVWYYGMACQKIPHSFAVCIVIYHCIPYLQYNSFILALFFPNPFIYSEKC